MKPATRLGTSAAFVGQKATVRRGFVCLQCRHRSASAAQKGALSTSIPTPTQRHASSTSRSDSLTERLRRKLWGTDNPPGHEDPYGGLSTFEQRQRKGKKDTVAVAEEAPQKGVALPDAAASNYVPATTWDGLDHIGGATGWWEEAWDQEHPFNGFMAPSKMTSREEIEAAVRRAVIEVFTLRDAERPLNDAVNGLDDKVTLNLENIVFSESDDESVILNFLGAEVRQEILDSMNLNRRGPAQETLKTQPAQEDLEIQPAQEDLEMQLEQEALGMRRGLEVTGPDQIPELEAIMDESSEENMADNAHQTGESHTPDIEMGELGWQSVPLGDTDVKFAVLKRVMQLTGVRIPDHAIRDINTAKALVGHLVKKPKPKKLAESLLVNERLTTLPNLQIFDRRYTPIDKEKEIGRWKVIEKELERRGLPVTGTA